MRALVIGSSLPRPMGTHLSDNILNGVEDKSAPLIRSVNF
jgi:hypothetical protein